MNDIDDIEYLVKGMPEKNDAFTNSTAGTSMLKLEPAQDLYGINNANYNYPLQFNYHQGHSSIKVEPVMNDDNTTNIYNHRDRNQNNSQASTGRNQVPILNFEPVQNLPDVGDKEINHPMARSGDCVQNTGNKQQVAQDVATESRNLLHTVKAELAENLPDVGDEEINHPMARSDKYVQNTGNKQQVAQDANTEIRNLLHTVKAKLVENLPNVGDEEINHPMARSDKYVQNTGNKQQVTQDAATESRSLLHTVKAELDENLPDVRDEESNHPMAGSGNHAQNIGKLQVVQDVSSKHENLFPIVKVELVQDLPDAGDEEGNPSGHSNYAQNNGKQQVARDVFSRTRSLLLPIVKTEVIQNLPDVVEGNNQHVVDNYVKNNQSEARDISIPTISGSSEEQHNPHNTLSEVHKKKNSWIFHRFTESSSLGSDKYVNPLERQNETLCSSKDKKFATRISGSKASMTKPVESFSCTSDPQGQGSSFPLRINHIGNARQHCLRYCTVSLTRIEEQISKGSCILNNDLITYSGPTCFRIIPVQNRENEPVHSRDLTTVLGCQTVGDCNVLDEKGNSQVMVKTKSGRNIKMFRTAFVEEDNKSEDKVEDNRLSEDKDRDDSQREEIDEDCSTKKDCLKLLRVQEKKRDKTETYIKKKSFVDSETLNKYMEWNADLICLVCQKTMTSLTEWNKHYYNWTKCSTFFVDEEKCCLTCPPCETSFKYFTDWSRHMFMEGPHGDMGFNAFPSGFIKSFQKTCGMVLLEASENEQMKNIGKHIYSTENTLDQIHNSLTLNQQGSEQEVNTWSRELNKQCFRFTVGFVCRVCQNRAVYRYETRAVSHVYDVHVNVGKPGYRCNTCNQYFKTKHYQRKHRLECHQGMKRPREKKECHICGKHVHDMRSHLLVHNSKEIPCIVCGIMIKEGWMGKHLKRRHSGIPRKKKYCTCEVCGKTLSVSSIQFHRSTHLENRKRVSCSLCDSSVLSEGFAAHMLLHSGGQHQCEFCGKQFILKHTLTSHIQRVHLKTATKKTCKVCSASVKNLDVHMKCHQKKQFACSICGKKFRLKHHRNTHVNGVHENIRPFQCPVCGYKFTLKQHLTTHMNSVHNKMEDTGKAKTTLKEEHDQNTESNGHAKKRKKEGKSQQWEGH